VQANGFSRFAGIEARFALPFNNDTTIIPEVNKVPEIPSERWAKRSQQNKRGQATVPDLFVLLVGSLLLSTPPALKA
jgi:hypothetical protein